MATPRPGRRTVVSLLGFIAVVWLALTLTAPPGSATPVQVPTGAVPSCPPSAPNAAAGCLLVGR